MKAQLKILSGTPEGAVYVLSQDEVLIGRHPKCDVQFHPETDLDVSTRHAQLVRDGANWILRDLDSRNGTFVNGFKINSDTKLDDTDQITLSDKGPKIEFRLVAETVADTAPDPFPVPMRKTGAAPAPVGAEIDKPAGPRGTSSTGVRVRAQVAHETRHLRAAMIVLIVAVAAVAGAAFYVNVKQRNASARQITALQTQIDSVLGEHASAVASLQGRMLGLAAALDSSQRNLQGISDQLASARQRGDRQRVAALERELQGAMTELAQQRNAARIDYTAIHDANQRAVAMIYVQFSDGTAQTGTAFAVRSDATMITNRHVVAGADGTLRATQIAIQFADSEQFFRASLVRTHPDFDLAIVRVNGWNPASNLTTVRFNLRSDTIPEGVPVAMIGFPLGTELPMQQGERGTLASTSLVSGIVSKNIPGDIQINGYGAVGASGSPIFDANGLVIAVLYAGRAESLLLAVPARIVTQLIETAR